MSGTPPGVVQSKRSRYTSLVMKSAKPFNWKIAGVGGYGLQTVSHLLGKLFQRGGFSVHVYDEFPSIIKGGPSSSQVALSETPVRSYRKSVDLLICLNGSSIHAHIDSVVPQGWIIYDSDEVKGAPPSRKDVTVFPVPMTKLTADAKAEKLTRNVVALGVTLELLGYPRTSLHDLLTEEYGDKGEEVVAMNIRAAAAGADYVKEHAPGKFPLSLKPKPVQDVRMLMNGNDALSIGAVAAGCRFYAAYPMTPASSILGFMVSHGPAYGMVVRQLPDEIAVMNAAIGASFAGVRSMVATSGGGFALMVEALGLAAMTETPLVAIDAQRPGPATGLPTWTEQGDLSFILHAAPGDFPRVVLAPGDPGECFDVMPVAFNIADVYQTPVLVLTDKNLAECWTSVAAFSMKGVTVDRGAIVKKGSTAGQYHMFPRYAIGERGIAPRPLPGTPGLPFVANSDEHDEFGFSNEEPSIRQEQQARRMQKLETMKSGLPKPVLYGPKQADLTVIGWGSSKGPILDALDVLHEEGLKVNFLSTMTLSPFPVDAFLSLLKGNARTVLVEGNATGQFGNHIAEQAGVRIEDRILRFDGRPFEATELADAFRERLKKKA